MGFSVHDNEPGIDSEDQTKLFERYFMGKVGHSFGIPGTGFGLSIADEIAQRHQGWIVVKSTFTADEGVEFTVWLPGLEIWPQHIEMD